MIRFTTSSQDGACTTRLSGKFELGDMPSALADHLHRHVRDAPLLVDLTGVDGAAGGDMIEQFVMHLATKRRHRRTVLIHTDVLARRNLRSMRHAIPVVEEAEQAVRNQLLSLAG